MEHRNNVDKLLESLEQSRRAEPSAEFLLRMENLALRYTSVVDKVSLSAMMGIAATFLLLLMVNMMILSTSDNSTSEQSSTDIASLSYDLIPTKSLYDE